MANRIVIVQLNQNRHKYMNRQDESERRREQFRGKIIISLGRVCVFMFMWIVQ